jgi:cell division protein FtsL
LFSELNYSGEKMDTRSFSIGLLAVSIICLSGSIVFFTIQFININREIPEILTEVEKAAEKVETVVKEAERMREIVPSITKEISETRNKWGQMKLING